MKIFKTWQWAHLAILFFAAALSTSAQGFSSPTGRVSNFLDWNESFEGSTGSSGREMVFNSSATYYFSHYSVGTGIPFYLDRSIFPDQVATSHGIGDAYLALGSSWRLFGFDYAATLTGFAPTGNPDNGFGTGHVTFDWNNRVERDFGMLAPFVDAGLANRISDTPFFYRPFTSYGNLAHLEAGANVGLSRSFSLLASAYEIAPWGTQTIISRDVTYGSTGSGGQNGRVFEVNHLTTGPAYINHDDGFTAGLNFHPRKYLNLALGYTRSIGFAFNSFSWGIEVNMSGFISRTASER